MNVPSPFNVSKHWKIVVLSILLIAAGLRLIGIVDLSPPGLEHDEVAHWLINKDILDGQHSLYFAEAYGHEAGFHYVQTIFLALLGDNILALRLPSAFAGLLLVAVAFSLAWKLFDLRTALLATALLAVLFWPVFYSRLALRAISLPLLSGASLLFWWLAFKRTNKGTVKPTKTRRISSNVLFIAAAILAGLSLYTYMASRVVPVFYILYTLYLFAFHRERFRLSWPGMIRFYIVLLVIISPLIIYLLNNPGVESRISEVNQPLTMLLDGRIGPVFENSLKIAGMFGILGDPLWRQNVAHLPVFEPIIASFFYIGLGICLWRWREPRYALITLWLLVSVIPSIVTIDAPSSIRMVNALPVIAIFPVIGLEVIHFLGRLSTVSASLSTRFWRIGMLVALLVLFFLYIARTAQGIYITWPANDEVRFVWQEAFAESADYLDRSNDGGPVAVAGWTPETMDPPTMELSLERTDLSLRFFDPANSLIAPVSEAGQETRIIRPSILPLDPYLENMLVDAKIDIEQSDSFTLYTLDPMRIPPPSNVTGEAFGDELLLLGYEWPSMCQPGKGCSLVTYWQVNSGANEPRRIFLHLVDDQGKIITQDDRMGAPSTHWRSGDIIIQLLTLELPSISQTSTVRIGVFNTLTGHRLVTADGAEYINLDRWTSEE